ncbi:hypothetical protein K443DRAFT_680905 [Laccaria amethystina LaAM-08-1]|uniref:Uncharacterized protein n=1 Tax=Laccaria amethystina LaAM-08-1 TaxID=1095629 RepID=A0A0C9XQG8_9AGAR|nr:hypothetical protein K443DRAFT_680905 [Laccaria amethystina LaAM-08-1]
MQHVFTTGEPTPFLRISSTLRIKLSQLQENGSVLSTRRKMFMDSALAQPPFVHLSSVRIYLPVPSSRQRIYSKHRHISRVYHFIILQGYKKRRGS